MCQGIDLVQHYVCAPKHCMLTVRAGYLSYLPLQNSPTHIHTILRSMFRKPFPFLGGLFIPVIPDVKFHVINIKSNRNMQRDFYNVVNEIGSNRIFKGILVFVTENFLLQSAEDFYYLNHFRELQPDTPYALGGCIVEDTMFGPTDIDHVIDRVNDGTDFVSENLISIGMFTLPKISELDQSEKNNFEVFSLVIESSDSTKAKIQKTITEFSNKVPRFEHSIVLKLSCIGRDQKHDVEQNFFRDAFPNTRLIGCYGNGELGLNHPERATDDMPSHKRFCPEQGPQIGIIYSYSTIFFYIGWGKITSPQGPVKV
ncbi:uncharacterized protein LOC128673012 isoform X2 [Plodia interpunctella]|uniref:uncharacterized protein LOC128673012 isoform X2 n=1 Tax=Plodia interpunctella TaxID=58824 RepID=UPI00236765EF|nr:uncharacterized protein LOC128673012 isoform X2 [Plodia interpunctella]